MRLLSTVSAVLARPGSGRRLKSDVTEDNRSVTYDEQTVEVMRRVLKSDSNAIDVGAHARDMLMLVPTRETSSGTWSNSRLEAGIMPSSRFPTWQVRSGWAFRMSWCMNELSVTARAKRSSCSYRIIQATADFDVAWRSRASRFSRRSLSGVRA
jgi:hypothetical protein